MNSFWIAIDKPIGITSAKCLSIVRKLLNIKKIGHTGTLDPFASGVLCIAVGEATKTIPFINTELPKEYEFTIKFGEATDTLDSDGEIIARTAIHPSKELLDRVLPKFIGKIEQIPPKFSAIKVNGKRAYHLARAGENFKLPTRKVTVQNLQMLKSVNKSATFKVTCSKGTYVRTLGDDIAKATGSLGHLIHLRRTKDLIFENNNIISLEILKKIVHNATEKNEDLLKNLQKYIYNIDAVLDDIPAVNVYDEVQLALQQGKKIKFNDKISTMHVRAKNNGQLIAICAVEDNAMQPLRVFNI